MNTPQMANIMPDWATWGADNGRFSAPEKYTDESYLGWLERQPIGKCLFATAPDVLGDHDATVKLSMPLLPRIRSLGYPAAFVAQDGFTEATTPWDDFDVLFIGGSTKFKLEQAKLLVEAARFHGKTVHMGRVNSYRRLHFAWSVGCKSADGTFLKYAPTENEQRMLKWFAKLTSKMEAQNE